MHTHSCTHTFSAVTLVEQSLRIWQKITPTLRTKEKTVFFNYLNIVSQPHNFSAFGAGNNLYCKVHALTQVGLVCLRI